MKADSREDVGCRPYGIQAAVGATAVISTSLRLCRLHKVWKVIGRMSMKYAITWPVLPLVLVAMVQGRPSIAGTQGRSLLASPLAYYPDETSAFSQGKKVLRASRFDTPPVIDGNLDDRVWAGCKECGDFCLLDTSEQRRPVSEKTSFRLGYDKDGLYVAIRCEESAMDRLSVSAKPQPETRDGLIENQDVVHIMFGSPHWRNDQFGHICVNAAGEFTDTLMNWKPGMVGWYHRGATLKGVEVKASRDAKGWNVEMAVKNADVGTWGSDGLNMPWAFQVVRFERPHGELSSWNPATVFPHGPDHFGVLFLAQEMPLYVEHLKLIHLDQTSYAVRAVVRRLTDGTLNAVLSVNDKPEGRTPISLDKPLSVVFLPVEIDRAKLSYEMSYGRMVSKPVSYNVFAAWDKVSQKVMLGSKQFRKEETGAGLVMPGLNNQNIASHIPEESGLRSLVPETDTIIAGRRALAVKFNLPFGDDLLPKTKFVLRLRSTTPPRRSVEMSLTAKHRSGVFALDTGDLKPGVYSIELETRGKRESSWNASFHLGVLADEFSGDVIGGK